MAQKKNKLEILYDGECPFCRNYVRLINLKEAFDHVTLTDLRQAPERVKALSAMGYDLDQGFIVMINDKIYHGPDAVNVLALMTSKSTWFNQLNGWLFTSPKMAKVAYPICVFGRNLVLRILGRQKIHSNN